MKFGRMMVALELVATLGLLAAGVQGYSGRAGGDGLAAHILVGLTALLLFVLAHGWVLVYLLGLDRMLRGAMRDGDVRDPAMRTLWWRTLPPLLLAVLAGIGLFVLGTQVYAERVSPDLHGAALWLTVALQGWAAVAEGRALAASERAFRALRD